MRTRSGSCYYQPCESESIVMGIRKRRRKCGLGFCEAGAETGGAEQFERLPDDIVISIMAKLSSAASSPNHLFNALLACRRFYSLGQNPVVLLSASTSIFAVKAAHWSDGCHRFLKKCADAGNVEACYTLGMIRFYCLQSRGSGASLMARAAIASHAAALYSLAIIKFNGSGGSKKDKDLRAGVALCARAAFLGHIDAMRELGHCLQDGYGVAKNVSEGRRFLVQANARELVSMTERCPRLLPRSLHLCGDEAAPWRPRRPSVACPLLSDFGCNVPPAEAHPAVKFLVEWFEKRPPPEGLRMCSYSGCGRPETRKHEFRRCSVCGTVNYCSRACQALDWKLRHKSSCRPSLDDDWPDSDDDPI